MPDRREDVATRERLDTIAANYAATDAEVIRILKGGRWLVYLMVVLFVCGAVSSAYFYEQGRQRADDSRKFALRADALARDNQRAIAAAEQAIKVAQQAIVTGCDLLVRIAKQAGASPGQKGASKAAKINLELTITVIDEVLRTAPPAVRAEIASLYHQLRKAGPAIRLPDCATVGKQPSRGSNP